MNGLRKQKFLMVFLMFVLVTFGSGIQNVNAKESLLVNAAIVTAGNKIRVDFSGNLVNLLFCDERPFAVDINTGGTNPLVPTSCVVYDAANAIVDLTFSGTPFANTATVFDASHGLYVGGGAVMDNNGEYNLIVDHSASVQITDGQLPTITSVARVTDTSLAVNFSEVLTQATITKPNAGGFTVTNLADNSVPAVSAVNPGATTAQAILTVGDISSAIDAGLSVRYVAGGDGTVTDVALNVLADASVIVGEWQPPTLSSVVRNTDTQLTVTLSELAAANTITKSNDSGFVVTQTGSLTTFAVSAIAPGDTNDIVILTVANMAAAEGAGVTVTYTKGDPDSGVGNGLVTDARGNYLATDSTGLIIAAWAEGRRGGRVTTPTTTTTTVPTTPVPEVTVTVPYGQTAETTVSESGTTAAMSFGSAVSFPVAGAAVSVGVSGLADPAAGTAPVSIEVGTMSASRLVIQKMSAQGLKLDLELKVGEPQQIDVDGDGKMDLELLLEEVISVSDIKLTIKKLEVASTEDTTDETVVEPVAEINFYMDGRWVKLATSPTVYFIDKNNIRHVYINASIWESYFGKDYSKIELMPISELANYELGNSVPFKTGTLVKSPSSPKVYKVLDKGDLEWIKDESVAVKYFGADWAKQIKDLTDALLSTYNQVGILE